MEAFNRIPLLNNLNNYINLNMICEGAYGKIYLCQERNSKQKYIIKKSKEQLTEEDEPYFKNEIQSLPNLHHPAILKFHGFLIDHQYPTFVTDYMPNKSLDQILKLKKKDISPLWTVTKRYINFVGIAFGMKYLQDNEMTHRSLTPDNILLDENFYPRISFFNFSRNYESKQKVQTIENIVFIPPETIDDNYYYPESDVYSYAFISYQLITEIEPNIKEKDNNQKMKKIKEGIRPDTSMIKDDKIINFLTNCWSPEVSKRYSFKRICDDILKGEFESAFKGYDKSEVNRYIQLLKENENPPRINSQDITYTYHMDVSEGYNGERKPHWFTFPISFTVGDVIRQIEEKFDNKYRFSIVIKNKQGKKYLPEETENLYDLYNKQETDEIYAAKLDIYYKFVTEDGKYMDEIKFKPNEKLNEISSYLKYDPIKDALMFTDDDDYDNDFEYKDRLEFSYKSKTFSGQEKFESLHYRRHNIDRIIIKVRQIENNKKETDSVSMTDRPKRKRSIPYLFKEPESDYKCKMTVNSDQTINDVIEKIKEKTQIDFDFEFASSKELTDDLNFIDCFDNKKFVIIKKCSIQRASQRPSIFAKGRQEEFGWKSQKPTRTSIEKSNQKKDDMEDVFISTSSFRRKKPTSVKKYRPKITMVRSAIEDSMTRDIEEETNEMKFNKSSDDTIENNEIEDNFKRLDNYFIGDDDKEFQEVLGKIGEGETSITYKVYDKRRKETMCKKVLKIEDNITMKDVQNAYKEFEVIYSMKHPCICKAIGFNPQDEIREGVTTIAIFLEYLQHSMNEVLKSHSEDFTLKTKMIIEISHAMSYIHKRGLIHRDLKIDNIMLDSNLNSKVVDFGLVKIYESFENAFDFNKTMTRKVGTFAFMSPEMKRGDEYDYKTDVYSFGVVVYYIVFGNLPKTKNDNYISFPSSSKSASQFCIDLISRCLAYDPKDRPTFDEIISDIQTNSYLLFNEVDQEKIEQREQEITKNEN